MVSSKLSLHTIMQKSLNKDNSTFPKINTTSPIPVGTPLERKRRDSTAIVSSGYLLIDCIHTGALSGVIVGRRNKFLFFRIFL